MVAHRENVDETASDRAERAAITLLRMIALIVTLAAAVLVWFNAAYAAVWIGLAALVAVGIGHLAQRRAHLPLIPGHGVA